ncbi:MAG: serine hydrolase domain-containing protein, partial [Erythrobacter sp.]
MIGKSLATCTGLVALAWSGLYPAAAQSSETAASIDAIAPQIESIFAQSKEEAHVPALVYGVVKDGRLVLFKAMGDRDVGTPEIDPIDGDTRFRIASMSKAFTAVAILKLRDEGRLALSDPAVKHVPELAQWRKPTVDAPDITIDDLLRHTGGLVEDNPWGDRQQILPEDDFTRMIASGMDFAT